MLADVLRGRWEQVVLATKVGIPHPDAEGAPPLSIDGIVRCVTGSLHRLGTDHVDLLYLHQPDRATPTTETLTAVKSLLDNGRCGLGACPTSPLGRSPNSATRPRAKASPILGLRNPEPFVGVVDVQDASGPWRIAAGTADRPGRSRVGFLLDHRENCPRIIGRPPNPFQLGRTPMPQMHIRVLLAQMSLGTVDLDIPAVQLTAALDGSLLLDLSGDDLTPTFPQAEQRLGQGWRDLI